MDWINFESQVKSLLSTGNSSIDQNISLSLEFGEASLKSLLIRFDKLEERFEESQTEVNELKVTLRTKDAQITQLLFEHKSEMESFNWFFFKF